MSTRNRADAQFITHENYTAAVGAVTKTFTKTTNFILIENMDASIDISVSFDAGATFKTIKAGRSLSLDIDGNNILSYDVKSASGTPSVEALYGQEN